ncbi:PREDICTED: ankyrin repeat and LEM domain-containing protein 2-like [Amphimedon queenslandica]|uniref:LEM domain-containing protein n=1 Tax=Amphimedon queenslandica TaxID=400682 RepID=A0A1X7VN89_AMPQE|nr:PREDICTED: ankyrin repeat and LEM domain-containing protein 2-like [Amphimedon queenslandica]|eukprot:XP_003383625.2 PREDICTED: ankyrin repeat and LEM domain-containing protein 2-like [Amphimedon queenslandica]
MEDKGIDVKSLSDVELKEQLARHGVIGAVIMRTTRGVYEKKLANLIGVGKGNEADTGCHVAQHNQNGSVSSDSVAVVLPASTVQTSVSSSDLVSRNTDSNSDLVSLDRAESVDSASSNSHLVSSNADPISSSIDSVSTGTDPIPSNIDSVSTSTDPVSSNIDSGSSSADLASSNADSVSKPTPLYFAVATSTSTPEETRSSLSPFYHDHEVLRKAIKGTVGTRFKKFSDQSKAEEFSKTVFPEELGPKYSLERALSPLPGVKKTRDKNVLAKIIQEGNAEEFLKTVWGNPRYLLGSGDTPEIIHPGTRRNALHLAALENQLEICKHIMSIIQSDRFWSEVYPVSDVLIDAAMSSNEKKRIEGIDPEVVREGKRENALRLREESKSRLVDLYLNIQDGNERAKVKVSEKHYTPLHIASMYGFVDIVEFLMSFPATDTTKKDNQGRTAADLACTKSKSKSNEELKSKIKHLINNPSIYYVPVIRSIDNSSPASLGSPVVLDDSSLTGSQSLNESLPLVGPPQVTTSPLVGQAFAGPLSPAKARGLLKEWKSPSCSDLKKKASLMKRSDPDRGLERIGRLLAHKDGIGWTEYWEFLGSFADFSKPEGLRKLDKHIFTLCHSAPLVTPSIGSVRSSSNRTRSRLSLLTSGEDSPKQKLFADEISKDEEEVGVVSNGDHAHSKPTTNESEDPLPLVSSIEPGPSLEEGLERMNLNEDISPLKSEPDTIEYSCKTPSRIDKNNAVYIDGGSVPSKLDLDVLLALCGVEVDVREYPHVYQWKRLIESYNEEERKQWATPRSLNKHTLRRTEESLRPFSPLVYYSPPPLSPLLSNSPSSARRTPLPFKNFPLTPQHRMPINTPTKTWF